MLQKTFHKCPRVSHSTDQGPRCTELLQEGQKTAALKPPGRGRAKEGTGRFAPAAASWLTVCRGKFVCKQKASNCHTLPILCPSGKGLSGTNPLTGDYCHGLCQGV